MPYPEPTLYAVPLFLAALLLEPAALRRRAARGAAVRGFERRDTRASLGMGIGSIAFVSVINLGIFLVSRDLWAHRVTDLGAGLAGWAAALVGWDFAYYWHHRVEHEHRIFWACHVSHHSSRYYNLATALRQPWTPVTGLLFYPWLALVGVAPWLIMASGGINLIYQFWIHTEAIDRMPRWFEAVFNTPSHHRVHHGKNPEYLDRNYGGILVVWDRLFLTFAPERAPVVYGLTHDIERQDLLSVAFHEYAALARDAATAGRVRARDALGVLFHGPAWTPPSALRSSTPPLSGGHQ
jgi:sterol desaturase/sphingolipid hydroxylase (fatty acid hydroxylase superfamily)